MEGKIYLNTELFPEGHKLEEFVWSARLMPGKGLFFDFALESGEYDSSDQDFDYDSEADVVGIWNQRGWWRNSHQCWISSVEEDEDTGFCVGDEQNKLDFKLLDKEKFFADPAEGFFDRDERAFRAFIIAYDSVGDHEIAFARTGNGLYTIDWKGKIALLNESDIEFDYDFSVNINSITFSGIRFPARLSIDEAKQELAKYVSDIEDYKIVDYRKDPRHFPEPRFIPID